MRNRNLKLQPRATLLRIGGAAAILAVLDDFGIDSDEVLVDAGIDSTVFGDPDNFITYATRDRLFQLCVARSNCQHFGLLVGQRMNLSALGLVGLLTKTSSNVGAALRSLVEFLEVHSQGAVMTLRIDDDLALLTYDTFQPGLVSTDQTGDGAVAMMLNVMRSLCGKDFRPVETSFAHRRPANVEPYRKCFKGPLYFDAEHYALVFSRDWLSFRPPGADGELNKLLKEQLDAQKSESRLEFADQVRKVLRSALIAGYHSETQISKLFSIQSHTLSRRLEASGTNFQELVDECRFEISREMLRNTSLSVAEIAVSLGYTRASSFIRAFRRWSGVTPGQWRQKD